MEATKGATLSQLRERMEHAVPWTASMLHTLKRDDFMLTHVRHSGGPAWFMRVSPPAPLQEGLGLAPEVLVIAVGGEVQARDLHEANGEVIRSGLRLDGNLVVVADQGSSSLSDRLDRIGGHGQRIPWRRGSDGKWPSLTSVLRDSLPGFDAFEERDAVRGAQLVGRDSEVSSLRTRVVRGDAVGLFGYPVASQVSSHFVEREAVLEVMREVVTLLRKRYPSALDVLVELAGRANWEEVIAVCGGPEGDTARTLRNFGLITSENALPEGLAWYLSHSVTLPHRLKKTA